MIISQQKSSFNNTNYKIQNNRFLYHPVSIAFGSTEKEVDGITEADVAIKQANTELDKNNSLKSMEHIKKALIHANEYLVKFSPYKVNTLDEVYVNIINSTKNFYKKNEKLYKSASLPFEYPSKKELVTITAQSLNNLSKSINNNSINLRFFSKDPQGDTKTMQKLISGYRQVFECSKELETDPGDFSEASNNFKKTIYNNFKCEEFSPNRTPGDLTGKVAIALKILIDSKGEQSEPLINLFGQFKSGNSTFKKNLVQFEDNRPLNEILDNLRANLSCNKYVGADSGIKNLLGRVEDLSFLHLITKKPGTAYSSSVQNLADDKLFRQNVQKILDLGIIDKNTFVLVDTGHTLPVIKQLETEENRDVLGQVYSSFKINQDDYMPAMDSNTACKVENVFSSLGNADFLDDNKKTQARRVLDELSKYENSISSRFDSIKNYYYGQIDRIKDQSNIYYGEEKGSLNIEKNEKGPLVVGIDIHRTKYMEPGSLPSAEELKALGYNKIVYLFEGTPKHLSLPEPEVAKRLNSDDFGYNADELTKNDATDYIKQMRDRGINTISEGIDTRPHRFISHDDFIRNDVVINTFNWGIGEIKKIVS